MLLLVAPGGRSLPQDKYRVTGNTVTMMNGPSGPL